MWEPRSGLKQKSNFSRVVLVTVFSFLQFHLDENRDREHLSATEFRTKQKPEAAACHGGGVFVLSVADLP